MKEEQLKLEVSKLLRSKLISEFYLPNRDKVDIENHINDSVSRFLSKVLKIALAHKYPFIESVLDDTYIKFEKQAINGKANFYPNESKFL